MLILRNIYCFKISTGKENNFEKYTLDTVTDFGVPYDYTSVMHYPDRAFSKNGEKTIIPVKVKTYYE